MEKYSIDAVLSEAKSMPKETGKILVMECAIGLSNEGNNKAAAKLMRDYANHLIENGHYGWAADMIREAALWCKRKGYPEYGALMLTNLASIFSDSRTRLYGWAGDSFYDAAMCYIELGDVNKAIHVLRVAYEGYFKRANDFHTPWLKEHLTVLADRRLKDIDKLDTLASDFRLKNRNSWERSCKQGIESILRRAATLAEHKSTA
jgi:hypothetical protein